jgi:hypothetical protein
MAGGGVQLLNKTGVLRLIPATGLRGGDAGEAGVRHASLQFGSVGAKIVGCVRIALFEMAKKGPA